MTRAELKTRGTEQVKGNILTIFLIGLIIAVISGALSFTFIGVLIIAGPFAMGGVLNAKKMHGGGKADIETGIAGGFKHAFVPSLILFILQSIFIYFWSLLFIIPGIIKSMAYSMSWFILSDNPEIGGNEAITKSRKLMNGHKMEYFILQLSWILHYLLGFITFGIYFIWLMPKVSQTNYNFYLELKAQNPNCDDMAGQGKKVFA